METLFHLTTEELSKICMEAEFDENGQFIIDEDNCIHQDGIIIFKRPIHILYEDFICEILDTLAIIKKERGTSKVYMFAMTEIKTEETSDVLCDFYDFGNGLKNNCRCMHTHNKGWHLGSRIWEVQDEEM